MRPFKLDKGKLNGSCNREACQRPGATWFNYATQKHYCRGCAHMINRANPEGWDHADLTRTDLVVQVSTDPSLDDGLTAQRAGYLPTDIPARIADPATRDAWDKAWHLGQQMDFEAERKAGLR